MEDEIKIKKPEDMLKEEEDNKEKRREKEKAFARLLRKKLIYKVPWEKKEDAEKKEDDSKVKEREVLAELVDWDMKEKTMTIQEQISKKGQPLVFQLWTIKQSLCKVVNPPKIEKASGGQQSL